MDWSICKGILKERQSFGLVTSHVVWNAGMLLSVPQEGLPLLHKIQESKPPLSIHFFAEVRGARNNVCDSVREKAVWGKDKDCIGDNDGSNGRNLLIFLYFFMCHGFLRSKHPF